jgi:hypothetical protein
VTHRHPRGTARAALPLLSCLPLVAIAAEPPSSHTVVAAAAQDVVVEGHYDNAVGSSDAASQGSIRSSLLKSRPALRPGEVLEFVPGVIVTQHSGDGKANQYFLRGFNLDHGTDFATTVNGLPVNMPSHGHGQGYSDLNFLIPELVDRIDYRKGPYFAQSGDFSAAGSADIRYRRRLDAPLAQVTFGQRGYQRLLGAGSTRLGGDLTLLGALEVQRNDGPWTVPEDLRRLNGTLTLSGGTGANGWSASAMHYQGRWTATDQVPQRLIDAGNFQGRSFGRFDSLDPTTGGTTRRSSLSGEWRRSTETTSTRLAAYAMAYRLSLFSNFTYALCSDANTPTDAADDCASARTPGEGDQFAQQDRRRVYGVSATHAVEHRLGPWPTTTEVGLQLRHDRIRVGLFDTVARQVVGTTRDDQVRQTQTGLYAQTATRWMPWLRSVAGVRADHARFDVDSLSNAANSGRASDQLLSPKLSLVAGPWARTELFFNAGRGFHSNDARGTTARIDPRTGDAVNRVPPLVAAKGLELGARTEWLPGLQSSLALWQLEFDSELVYVGDAGATEPNRPSKRHGVEWNNRWAPRSWLLVDADLAWSHARFRGPDPDGAGDRIPNAVDRVASVAVTVRELGPWSASLQWRYLGSGALVEDNSVRSRTALTTNLRIGHRFTRNTELTLDVFNLFDRRVNDIEYYYTSRVTGEPAPVADRHLHPAEPRTLRLTLLQRF